jgi:hypothetical protein
MIEQEGWACATCTFVNKSTEDACTMCGWLVCEGGRTNHEVVSDLVAQFVELTGANMRTAQFYFESTSGSGLEAAVALFFEQDMMPPPKHWASGGTSAAATHPRAAIENDQRRTQVQERVFQLSGKKFMKPKPTNTAADDGNQDLCTLFIHFHHILNEDKREVIQTWAMELELGGLSRHGTPGLVIIEGCRQSLYSYVARLRTLKWQTMELRAMQQIVAEPGETMEKLRRFKLPFEETSTMGAFYSRCRDAGLSEFANRGTDDKSKIIYLRTVNAPRQRRRHCKAGSKAAGMEGAASDLTTMSKRKKKRKEEGDCEKLLACDCCQNEHRSLFVDPSDGQRYCLSCMEQFYGDKPSKDIARVHACDIKEVVEGIPKNLMAAAIYSERRAESERKQTPQQLAMSQAMRPDTTAGIFANVDSSGAMQ